MTEDTDQDPGGPQIEAQGSQQADLRSWGIDLDLLRGQIGVAERVTDLTATMTGMVQRACGADPAREPVDFAVGLTVVPQADGRAQPCFVVVLGLPSLIVGEKANVTVLVPNLWLAEEEVQGLVRDSLEGIRASRSSLLAQQNDAGPGTRRPGQFGS
jgi:hypothetical protein